jgi:3-deoxy-D-manno-octulosonic-acid transferase
MLFLYNVVLLIASVPAVLVLAVRYRKRGSAGVIAELRERFGRWQMPSASLSGKPVLWIHGASLGEVRSIEPLIAELGEYSIVLTTLTRAGYDYARSSGLGTAVFLAPLDFSRIVDRTFALLRPAALILVETELWPGLMLGARKYGCRLVIINARLSGTSFSLYRILRPFWARVLRSVDRCAARATEDAERFAQLGLPRERITVTGNIKYDRDFSVSGTTKEAAGFADTDVLWVSGSTRGGEEQIIFDTFLQLAVRFPKLKLVIAPRHVNRVAEIGRIATAKGISCALRSAPTGKPFSCLLVDTFGELMKFYSMADVVFVGGSLVPKGGQNPIEPAACGKPVVFGPFMDNFITESRVLRENGGGLSVRGADELGSVLEKLLSNAEYRKQIGEKARQAVEQQRGALARTADIIRATLRIPYL